MERALRAANRGRRSIKRQKVDYKLEASHGRSSSHWNIRVYLIAMCQHADAWLEEAKKQNQQMSVTKWLNRLMRHNLHSIFKKMPWIRVLRRAHDRFVDLEKVAQRMIVLNEANPLGYSFLVKIHYRQGNLKEARKFFESARDTNVFRIRTPPACKRSSEGRY